MSRRRFPIRIGRRTRPLLLLFGVRGDNAYVDIDGELDARFGVYRLRTPVANLASCQRDGPWRWITAVGVRRSLRHGDVTFAGVHDGGVRIDFRQRVPWGPFRVPAFYVTVEDEAGFTAALRSHGVPERDPGTSQKAAPT
jgi:hypothetical protein